MPDMMRIYRNRLDFTDDAAVLEGKMDAVWQQYESVTDSARDNGWRERECVPRQQMEDTRAERAWQMGLVPLWPLLYCKT